MLPIVVDNCQLLVSQAGEKRMDGDKLLLEITQRYGEFLKTKEVAECLRVHPETIRRYATSTLKPDHTLKGAAGHRFAARDVVNFILSHRTEARG